MGRLAPSVPLPGPPPGCADEACALPLALGWMRGRRLVAHHYHHVCWACGAAIVTGQSRAYQCRAPGCGVMFGPETLTRPDASFDPDLAAVLPSPG